MRRAFIEFKGGIGRLVIAMDSIIAVGDSQHGDGAFVDVGNGEPYVVEQTVDEVLAMMRAARKAMDQDELDRITST